MLIQGVTAIHYATWLMTFVSRENRNEQAYTLLYNEILFKFPFKTLPVLTDLY